MKSFVVQSLVREEKMHVTSEIMEKLGNRVQTLQQQFSATWTPAHKKHQLHHSILFVTRVQDYKDKNFCTEWLATVSCVRRQCHFKQEKVQMQENAN